MTDIAAPNVPATPAVVQVPVNPAASPAMHQGQPTPSGMNPASPLGAAVAADAARQGNPAGPADPQEGLAPQPNPAEPPANERRIMRAADLANAELEFIIDGKPVMLTAEEAFRRIQRGESASKRYEEAAKMKREAMEWQQRFTASLQDPQMLRSELAAAGYNPSEIAKALYEQEQLEASLTPEQRRVRELELQVRQHEEQERDRQEQYQAQQVSVAQEAYERDFNLVINEHNVPEGHPMRGPLMRMLADATYQAMTVEGRQFTKREARALVAQAVTPYQQRHEPTREEILARLTAEDIAAWNAQQQANKPVAAPQLPRDQPRYPAGVRRPEGTPLGGKFAPQEPRVDRNGRTIVGNMANAWKGNM